MSERPHATRNLLLQDAVLAVIYALAAGLGLSLGPVHRFAALVWAPSGIALATLLRWGTRHWLGVAIGATVVNAWVGAPLHVALAIGLGNTLAAVVGVHLLRHIPGFRSSLGRVRDAVGFIFFAAALSTLVGATIGSFILLGSDLIRAVELVATWRTWWLGDAVGVLVVAPLLLTAARPTRAPSARRLAEAIALGVTVIATGLLVFAGIARDMLPIRQPTMLAPVLLWAALRFGQPAVAWSMFAFEIVAVSAAATGHGPFVRATLTESLLTLQLIIAAGSITFLTFGGAIAERTRVSQERAASLARERAARERAEELEQRESFLSEATKGLLDNVDYAAQIEAVAQLAIPRLGDWCTVDLREDGILSRMTVAHADGGRGTWARELARFAPDPSAGHGIARVIRTRRPEIRTGITDQRLRPEASPRVPIGCSRDPELLDILRKLGLRGYLSVPLIARGRAIGAMTFGTADAERSYDAPDVSLAMELARRVALAIDNAGLYRKLQRAIRMREEILAIVSHDLRNLLGTIALGTAILQTSCLPEQRRQLRRMKRSTRAMERLINDLLDAESIDAGKLSIERQIHDAASITREAVETFQSMARLKSIQLDHTIEPEDEPVEVLCDAERIHQALSNLLSNAIGVTPEGGTVTVELSKADGEVRFAVIDTGPGIPKAHQARLFERHWRARGERRKGIGLGLFITRGIIEAHGGRIWVESAVEHGSRFVFALRRPRSTAERTDAERAAPAGESPPSPNARLGAAQGHSHSGRSEGRSRSATRRRRQASESAERPTSR